MTQTGGQTTLRLMVVEDDEDDFQLLREACRRAGVPCVLEHHASGIRALAMLQIQHAQGRLPDLLICDLDLPDISGADILAHVRASAQLEALPVLIMTGSESPEDRRYCAAADHYFAKPRTLPEWTIVTSLLNRYAKRRAAPAPVPAVTAAPSPLILHVEDSEGDRLLFARAISRSGLQAELKQCECVAETRAYLAGVGNGEWRCPDLLVLDLGLPDGGGRELLLHIRASDRLRHLPVIILTGSDSYRDIQDCRELLVIDYVTKPRSSQQMEEFAGSLRQWFQGALAHWLKP